MHAYRVLRSALITGLSILFLTARLPAQVKAPQPTVPLWPEGAPGALGSEPLDLPKLTPFFLTSNPAQPPRSAVIVLPGGGYRVLMTSYEGADPAKWLNHLGISAFVLEYRLGPRYHYPIELRDADRALRWVRSHAADYGIDLHRIGVWGFSAGGNLAAILATHWDGGNPSAADPNDRVSSRPDFVILSYPAIHPVGPVVIESFKTLLGEPLDPRLVEEITSDHHVNADTPPTFLVHADDDPIVPPDNSVNYHLALRHAGVSAELHIYQHGGHGFGLAPLDPILSSWTGRLADWLRLHGFANVY